MRSVNMGLSCFSQVENILVLRVLSGVISVIRIKVESVTVSVPAVLATKLVVTGYWDGLKVQPTQCSQ